MQNLRFSHKEDNYNEKHRLLVIKKKARVSAFVFMMAALISVTQLGGSEVFAGLLIVALFVGAAFTRSSVELEETFQ